MSWEAGSRAGSKDVVIASMRASVAPASALLVTATAGAEVRPGSQQGGEEVARGRGKLVDTCLTAETARRSA
jgi:hypothetical protein